MSTTFQLEITAPNDTDILMVRDFAAPRELVWRAFTEPELMKRWLFGPDGWSLDECEVDLRVGGKYRYLWRKLDGTVEMGMGGEYREVNHPAKISATELFDDPWYEGEAISVIEFVEIPAGTQVRNTMHYASKEARDGIVASGMAEGVGMGYDRLDKIFAEFKV